MNDFLNNAAANKVLTGYAPFTETPELHHISEVRAFDRQVFHNPPSSEQFIRRCFHFELPPGLYDEMRKDGDKVYMMVQHTRPGCLTKMVMTSREKPKIGTAYVVRAFIADFDPVLYYKAKGGANGQN